MNKEDLHYCSKCLFSASENIREALDTIDLKSLPVDSLTIEDLQGFMGYLETLAQNLQRKAK